VDPATIAFIALAVCLFGALSQKAERSPLTPPMFFLGVGLLLGDAGIGWVHLEIDGEAMQVLAVTLGPLVGAAVGFLGGRVVGWGTQSGWINPAFQRIAGLGLALLAFGAAESVGGNGFIAAFVAGLTLGNTARGVCECLYEFGEAEGQLLTLLVFFAFGAAMLPEALPHITGSAVLYALLSLTVVRMVPVALSLLGTGLRPASIAFLGWFGPRGLASILFALLVVEEGSLESGPFLLSVVALTVLGSTFLHGVTAYPIARRYGAYTSALADAKAEHADAPELPVRISHATASSRIK